MAIDSYLTRKVAKPNPVKTGWAGRDIIPYGSFEFGVLKEAVAAIEGISETYSFDQNGVLQMPQAEPPPQLNDSENGLGLLLNMIDPSEFGSAQRVEVVRAITAILANAALKHDCTRPLQGQMELSATQRKRGKGLQHLYDELGSTDMFGEPYGVVPDWMLAQDAMIDAGMSAEEIVGMQEAQRPAPPPADKQIANLERDLQQYREGQSTYLDDHYTAGREYLKMILDDAETIRRLYKDEDVWRLHNTHPEAVNFYFAKREAEFLLQRGSDARKIEDIPLFVNSDWTLFAGRLDLKADSSLLHQAQTLLAAHPLRAEQTALAK